MSIKYLSAIYRNGLEFVDSYIRNMPTGKALDIGSGDGEYLDLLRYRGFKTFGLDIDKNLLKGEKNVTCASAENIPAKSATFDMVTCISTLEHVSNDDQALKEIERVLKKKGILLLMVPSIDFPFAYDPINAFLMTFGKKIPVGMWAWGHKRLYSKEQIEALLIRNGFRIKKFEVQSHFFIATIENYIPYLAGTFFLPIFKKIGRGAEKNFMESKKSLFYRLSEMFNDIDKKIFSDTNGVNLCFVGVNDK